MANLRITAVDVRNFKGIKDGKYPVGPFTKVSGVNEAGKTSFVRAIEVALGGGDISKYKNVHGKGLPEIDLEINGGDYIIQRRVKGSAKGAKETTVLERVFDKKGEPTSAYEKPDAPQTFIDSRYDARLSNPMAFVNASAADRVDILLRIVGEEVTPERVREAVGDDLWPIAHVPAEAGGDVITVLTRVRDAIFTARTGVNGSQKQSAISAEKLKRSIPPDLPEKAPDVATLEARRDVLAGSIGEARARAESTYRAAVAEATAQRDTVTAQIEGDAKAKAADIRRSADRRISEAMAAVEREAAGIRAEAERRVAVLLESAGKSTAAMREKADAEVAVIAEAGETAMETADAELERARATADKARAALLTQAETDQPKLDALITEIATLRAKADEISRVKATREQIATFEAEAKSLTGQADRLTAGLHAVDALKGELLASIPIPGLEIEGRTIKVDGVEFDELNLAKRLEFAAKVAALRAERHPLRLILLDDAEHLDKKHRAGLLVDLEKLGIQVVLAVVEEHEGEVKTFETAAAVTA